MSTKKTQKILVPKGTIQPNEDVLIEIPVELKDQPMVIARRPQSGKSRVKSSDLKMVEYDEEDPPVQPAVKYKPRRVAPQQESEEFLPLFSSSTMHTSMRSVPGLDNLDETEALEKQLIQKKLEEFQQARRMFILETTGVAAHSSHMFHNTTFAVSDDPGTFNESTYPRKNLNATRRNSCCNPITSDTHSFTKGRSSHDEDDRYSDKDQSSCLNSRNSTKSIPKKKSDSKRSQSFEHSTSKCGNKDCNTTSKSDTNIPYLQDLLIQFDNARHKLNTAVKLATTTLEHYTSRDSKDSIDGSCSNDNSTCSKWRNTTRVDQDNTYTRIIGNTSMNRQPPVLDTLYSKKSEMSRSSSRMMASKKAEELQSTLNSLLEGSLTETSHFDHDISAIPKCCKESKSSNSLKFARCTFSAHSRD